MTYCSCGFIAAGPGSSAARTSNLTGPSDGNTCSPTSTSSSTCDPPSSGRPGVDRRCRHGSAGDGGGSRTVTQVHPGGVLAVVAIAATVAVLAGCGGSSTTSKVNEAMGLNASDCSFVGRMLVGGTSQKVFQCSSDSDGTVGCYAVSGDEVADVSKPFSSLIALQNQQVDCGQ